MVMEFKSFIKLIVEKLIRFPEIEFAYLFGSILKKEVEKAEDIDIAIFSNETLSKSEIIRMKLELESLLSVKLRKDLEIAPLNFADPLFIHQVLRDKQVY